MNPSSLREICAKATKGPWKANAGTVREARPQGDPVCRLYSPAGAAPEAWQGIGDRRSVTAQLIARLSPETALAVYEALELILDTSADEHGVAEVERRYKLGVRALALLDGRTEP